jgi:hypothetical protein
MQRICTKCGVPQDEEKDFHKVSKRLGKPRGACKTCVNRENAARAAANPEKANARSKAWRDANPGRASAISRAWQLRNPDQFRAMQRKGRFNIDFDAMWGAQKGLCALCGGAMERSGKQLDSVVVDHDRSCCADRKSCGKCVRGLIHWSCNVMIGYAKEDPQVLRAAIEYIERWKARPVTE